MVSRAVTYTRQEWGPVIMALLLVLPIILVLTLMLAYGMDIQVQVHFSRLDLQKEVVEVVSPKASEQISLGDDVPSVKEVYQTGRFIGPFEIFLVHIDVPGNVDSICVAYVTSNQQSIYPGGCTG